MNQDQPEENLAVQNVGDSGEVPSIDNQSTDVKSTNQIESKNLIDCDDEKALQDKVNTNFSIYSSANLLIQESESLCEELLIHEPEHDPPPCNDEQEEKEAFASVESLENQDYKNEVTSLPTENVAPSKNINTSNECIENNFNNNTQTLEIQETIEINPINESQNEIENPIPTNSNESIQNDPHDESSQILISHSEATNNSLPRYETQREDENQNDFNLASQEPKLNGENEKKSSNHDPFLDLDIPKPDFTSSSDIEFEPDHLPPEEKDAITCKSPVDLETVLKTASPDESCQERISNQSGMRIEAPQDFIPSSQLMMTKRALEEGNSFLKSILNKLRGINQFLLEKTSKFLP